MDDLEQHFSKFYNRLLFLEQEIGEEEKTYENQIYITSYSDTEENKKVSSFVNKEKEKDEYVFLRKNGLVAKLEYGTWYNKKYKELHLYIWKDSYYEGNEKASVKELLHLVNEYIKNNYKEYDERIDKVIVGTDKTKDIHIKYRTNNILSLEYIKDIKIMDVTLIDQDIEILSRYKNLQSVTFKNCNLLAHNFYLLKTWKLLILNSLIEDLTCFNYLSVSNFCLVASKFQKKTKKCLTLNIKTLAIDGIDLNLKLFFLMVHFKNLIELRIDGKVLTPEEVSFLKVFYEVREMELNGQAYSFDFLEELTSLEQFKGYIELVNEKNLQKYKEKYQKYFEKLEIEEEREERFKNYIFYHNRDDFFKRKKFARDLLLSKIASIKWQGKISSATDEEVRAMYGLPYGIRKNLGREESIQFIETNFKDPFHLLSNTEESILSHIVGPTGERLVRPRRYGFLKEIHENYILGSNGKVYESVTYTNEQDITIPEYIDESKRILIENDNTVFDYYYNREISEEEKIDFLSQSIIDYLYKKEDQAFIKKFEYNQNLLKKEIEIQQQIEKIEEENYFLFLAPSHQYIEKEILFHGRLATTYEALPDDFLEEDNSLYYALKRTRNIELIRYTLEENFKEEKTSLEEQESCYKQINDLLNLWSLLDTLKQLEEKNDEIVIQYFANYFNTILIDFEKENYLYWYLEDVENFLSQYNLESEEYNLLTNYILMRQSRYRADLIAMKEEAEKRLFVLSKCYSIEFIMECTEKETGTSDPKEWLNQNQISQEECGRFLEYLTLEQVVADLNLILDFNTESRKKVYREMIPFIDTFTLNDLKQIKENIMVVSKYQDKFIKYTDYIYYYIYHKYPKWIELELRKCPPLPQKYESTITRELIPESVCHIEKSLKINKHPHF